MFRSSFCFPKFCYNQLFFVACGGLFVAPYLAQGNPSISLKILLTAVALQSLLFQLQLYFTDLTLS